MSAARDQDQPWSLHEKNFLLAEIIKAHNPHPSVLLEVIQRLGIQPNLYDIPMPTGRSVNSALRALDDLRRPQQPTPMSYSAYGAQTPSPLSTGPFPQSVLGKRSYDTLPGREIRPKPASAGGAHGNPSPEEHPQKRKRGRPKKVQDRANAETRTAGAATGQIPRLEEVVAPPGAGLITTQIVETQAPALQPPPPPLRAVPSPAPRMEISSMLTPSGPPSTNQPGSSSSGKRKRARSMRSEPDPDSVSSTEAGGARPAEEYESPYQRANPQPASSPARQPLLQNREDSAPGYPDPSQQDPDAPATAPPKTEHETDLDTK